ncbi:MAG: hypothetical protein Pg6C_17170 [Treponemataceae bacterium]|nr:MAG: hypothetical protein Pg6C_17170 [Treponemataceae bacterium]
MGTGIPQNYNINALVFNNGALYSIPGTAYDKTGAQNNSIFTFGFDANRGEVACNPMAGHAGGADIRPQNLSARLWLRIN